MKARYFISLVFLLLVVFNTYIFISGMGLSEQIDFFEKETKKLRQENIELEKKAYQANSLQFAASEAAALEFTKKAEPYFLQHLGVALKK